MQRRTFLGSLSFIFGGSKSDPTDTDPAISHDEKPALEVQLTPTYEMIRQGGISNSVIEDVEQAFDVADSMRAVMGMPVQTPDFETIEDAGQWWRERADSDYDSDVLCLTEHGHWDGQGYAYPGEATALAQDDKCLIRVIIHEIGHSLSAEHVDERKLMTENDICRAEMEWTEESEEQILNATS
jgi:hypothetical protein